MSFDFLNVLVQHAEKAAHAAPAVPALAVWLIPLLPVFGFLFQVFIGRKMAKPIVSLVSCGVVLGSALLSWFLFLKLLGMDPHSRVIEATLGPWINVPGLEKGWLAVVVKHRLVVDPLTSVMTLVITNIGFFIHWYSTGYMADEKRYARYFSYLNLFTGFMLILVMGSSILLMFVGWEGVGLCSYLLIGFWYEKKENAAAGMKAFVVNRVGDLAFTIGAMTLFVYLGTHFNVWTVDFDLLKSTVMANKDKIEAWMPTLVCILLFIGATGKSAQIPLFVWLPDAMAGPTPVSALIHAATMVTAGVYMIARMSFLFALAPAAMAVVAGVGALTALMAGTIGFAQNDIKKVLAYSTVSQLGFMFLGVGVGAWAAGIFHLFTHAFFKACLFLGSGSVIHGMGGEQDIRKMGGLKAKMPITFWTFVIASAALSGLFPLAGFFSKDEILWKAFTTHAFGGWSWLGKVYWLIGAGAAACTAFYMTRLVVKTFLGRPMWAQASAFSGGGVGHGHDEDDDDSVQLPPLGDDASLLDMGKVGPAGHGAHDAHGDAGHGGHGDDDAHGGGHGHGHHGEPHESPFSMWFALVMLAAASCVVGFLGMPHVFHVPNYFEQWLHPSVHVDYLEAAHGPAWLEWLLMLVSTGIAVGSIFLAWRIYSTRSGVPAQEFAEKHPELYQLALEKYRWDEFYDRNVIAPTLAANQAAAVFDGKIVDGAVNGTAAVTKWNSGLVGAIDNEVVDGAVNAAADATLALGRKVRRLQTGNIREYLTFALVGALGVIAIFCLYLTLRT